MRLEDALAPWLQEQRWFAGAHANVGGGSYDWYYLLRPNGKEVGVVGEDPETFRATYIKAPR